ncbi:MAG: GMC oxidoreductase [Streptosporangiales bacterium]|nr:GMC oxidoreductase [Streptosporangiales bacterium]
MNSVTRRSFLGGAVGAVAVTATGTAARGSRIPLTRPEAPAVVIGSGFGGGVAALRLAQAGVPVLVLERGRWWPTGPDAETFPHAATPDLRDLFYTSWAQSEYQRLGIPPYAGLLEPIIGDNLIALVAAGVGGGSLVYEGMTLQPTENLFTTWFPAQIPYSEMDSVYYPRVARMLGASTPPDALIASPTYAPVRVFADRARAAGYDVSPVPQPVDWSYFFAELAGRVKPSWTNGDCLLGVNNGGRHSVDVTYLRQARATGNVTVAALHNVTSVGQAPGGRWEVHADVTDVHGTVIAQKIITTAALFMAAGSVGTTRLLVSAAGNGTVRDLPGALGQGYGTNGDQGYIWTDPAKNFGAPQGGPMVYGSFEWDSNPSVANTIAPCAIPPLSVNTALPSLLAPAGRLVTPPLDAQSTLLLAYGVSGTRGRIAYDPVTGGADLTWPAGGDAVLAERIRQRVTAIAGPGAVLTDITGLASLTLHSLGGACMNEACDTEGRVLGQRGLYVVDGALMPGTTCACNPSMTIAAIAERALDRITATDVGTVFG